ncbi:MAG: hypothetical protein QOG25_2269 [Acetobacteraceae bacterium]|jgi:hypothetical protein|nr:hypothetical protein [Acetobacteraceae bacterium]
MHPIMAVALGGLAVMAASNANGQEPGPPIPDTSHAYGIGSTADDAARDEPRSPPLFTVGGLDVRVWAPVEPHYNSGANRDPAAESLWHAG